MKYRGEQVLRLQLYSTIIHPSIVEGEQLQQATAVRKKKEKATLFGTFFGLFMFRGSWIIRYRGEQVLRLLLYSTIIHPSIVEGEQLQQATAVRKRQKIMTTLLGTFFGLFMFRGSWIIWYRGEQILRLLLYSSTIDTLVLGKESNSNKLQLYVIG